MLGLILSLNKYKLLKSYTVCSLTPPNGNQKVPKLCLYESLKMYDQIFYPFASHELKKKKDNLSGRENIKIKKAIKQTRKKPQQRAKKLDIIL